MNTNNKYNPEILHRRSVRLRNYDYSRAGLYFVTLCVQNHVCILGKIIDGEMRLNEIGDIVCREWLKTAELRPNVALHNFVVMPNHFHGILEITENTDDNYVLKNDNDTHNDTMLHDVGCALPLHRVTTELLRTTELPQ